MSDKWAAISKEICVALWGEPNARLSKGDRWRWGNNGSKSLDAGKGQWHDFEADRGGGVIDLVETELQTDRAGALDWLKREGFISEFPHKRNVGRSARRSARPTRRYRPKAYRAKPPAPAPTKQSETALAEYAQRLWGQSKKIGIVAEHPFWRWATTGDKPGVLHPYCEVPGGIRYHPSKGLILAGVFPISAWGRDGIPFGLPLAVQALAIDQDGE